MLIGNLLLHNCTYMQQLTDALCATIRKKQLNFFFVPANLSVEDLTTRILQDDFIFSSPLMPTLLQAPVVLRLDKAIRRINYYPLVSVVCFANTYQLDSDLRYLSILRTTVTTGYWRIPYPASIVLSQPVQVCPSIPDHLDILLKIPSLGIC